MELETKRLILRELTMDDYDDLYEILSDADTMKYYPQPFGREKTRNWILWNRDNYAAYGFGLWAVIRKEDKRFLGECGITMQNIHGSKEPEIGYHINKRYWNQGYATEAAKACIEYAFTTLGFDKVYSYMKYTNLASQRVAQKNGMEFVMDYEDRANQKTTVYAISNLVWNK